MGFRRGTRWPWQCHKSKNTAHKADVVEKDTLGSFDARSRYSFRNIEEDFIPNPSIVLGEGISGPVIVAVNRFTGKECAAKMFDKTRLSSGQLDNLRREVNNYLKVDHPHVGRLLHVYEDSHRVSLVMELCGGKDLITRLEEKRQFSEKDASEATYQLLLALAYLHRQSIVHCDVKLENCLYDGDGEDAMLKLIDFGFSKVWDRRSFLQKRSGTTRYAAPEVFEGKYTEKCDMWSLGVVVFLLLGGSFPFDAETEVETASKVCGGRFSFDESTWCSVSVKARDFVKKLLVVDPRLRMSAAECLQHPWMFEIDQRYRIDFTAKDTPCPPLQDLVSDLRTYYECSHLKRAMLTMMAHHLVSIDLAHVQSIFLAIDTDRSGTLTRDNLFAALGGSGKQIVGITDEELDRIFHVVDIAGDGEIHFSGFVAALMSGWVHIDEPLIYEAFQFFDVSRTGKITQSDLYEVLGGPKFKEIEMTTLFEEGRCSPQTGISFERFSEHLNDSEGVHAPCLQKSASIRIRDFASRLSAKFCLTASAKKASSQGRSKTPDASRSCKKINPNPTPLMPEDFFISVSI